MATPNLPDGYHSVIPDLTVDGAESAIEFYKKAFSATEKFRMQGEDGHIHHAELQIGDTIFFLADEQPEMGYVSPRSGGSGVSLILNVEDVGTAFQQAVDAGAIVLEEVKDFFWGDRMGTVKDPFGHVWSLTAHVEDVPDEEVKRRADEWMQNEQSSGE
jgi:PhnB protein